MLDLFQIADACQGLGPLVYTIKYVFKLIQFIVPMGLILFGAIDLGRAVISSDEKEIKGAQSKLIKRCIYAAAIFFIVFIVNLIMSLVGDATSVNGKKGANGEADTTNWATCWNSVDKS